MTGITWVWHHYGPYAATVRHVEDELVMQGTVLREGLTDFRGNRVVQLLPVEGFAQWPNVPEKDVIAYVAETYGELGPSQLKDVTYQTEPMVTAQEGGVRGVVLNLDEVRPLPDIAPALRRLRRAHALLPEQDTDPEAFDELREINAELAETRKAATARMLEE